MTLHVTQTALGNAPAVEFKTLLRQNNLGAREAGRALIKHQGKVVAHVSFNGRVWQGKDYVAGAMPLFEPKGDL